MSVPVVDLLQEEADQLVLPVGNEGVAVLSVMDAYGVRIADRLDETSPWNEESGVVSQMFLQFERLVPRDGDSDCSVHSVFCEAFHLHGEVGVVLAFQCYLRRAFLLLLWLLLDGIDNFLRCRRILILTSGVDEFGQIGAAVLEVDDFLVVHDGRHMRIRFRGNKRFAVCLGKRLSVSLQFLLQEPRLVPA